MLAQSTKAYSHRDISRASCTLICCFCVLIIVLCVAPYARTCCSRIFCAPLTFAVYLAWMTRASYSCPAQRAW